MFFILSIVQIINVGVFVEELELVALVHVVVSVLMLVAGHVARLVDDVLATGNALSLARFIESLLRRAGVLGRVRQPVDGSRCFASLF